MFKVFFVECVFKKYSYISFKKVFSTQRGINMIYAPVLIPTLCRHEHFVRCIESLRRNTWAKYTDIYVALDYPLKKEHWDGYNKINEYLKQSFDEFKSFTVVRRTSNFGAARNCIDLRRDILEQYDSFIRTDDDCEFSPNFLEYMDKSLFKYKDDETVYGVTGYSYPIDWNIPSKYTAFKNSVICPMWGTGFWKDKYLKMEKDIREGYIRGNFRVNKSRSKMSDARYIDCLNGIYSIKQNNTNLLFHFSDVACGCYIQLANKNIITPVVSKVRNYGFDGTGEYCQNTLNNKETSNATDYDYREQEIDQNTEFDLLVEEHYDKKTNMQLMNDFDIRTKKQMTLAYLKYLIKFLLSKISS